MKVHANAALGPKGRKLMVLRVLEQVWSRARAAALDGWLWTYNHRRPHGALSHKPPIARLNQLNNLPGSYN